jgi:hypothetical protein
MMTALQTLADNGCSEDTIEEVLNDLIAGDKFEDVDDKRCCIALLFDYGQGDHDDPSDYSVLYGETIEGPCGNYLVLDDDEADVACRERIEDRLWSFSASFLAGETGIDQDVFEALQGKSEDANDAVRSIIVGSCGLGDFVESAISACGRGRFLSGYDDEEYEVSVGDVEYYVYRQN